MLARLWHHAVVGRHHEQGVVDAGCAHEHGRHEALVTGYVDEAKTGCSARCVPWRLLERRIRIAELDGDAARLLLGQVGGVHPGERAHQGGLAVIDMAGGADQHAYTSSFAVSV